MLKARPQWQILLILGGTVVVNIVANGLLYFFGPPPSVLGGRALLLLSAGFSSLLILAGCLVIWSTNRVLRRLSAGLQELQRGAYPLLVAPKSNPVAEHIRQFNKLSAELRARDEKMKAWTQSREGELAKTSRLLRINHRRVEALREMPQALVLVDSNNKIFAVDEAAAELIGAPAESLSNTPLEQAVARMRSGAANPATFDASCARLREGEVEEIQLDLDKPREARLRIARMWVAGAGVPEPAAASPSPAPPDTVAPEPRILVNPPQRTEATSAGRGIAGRAEPDGEVERMKTEFLSTVSHELRTPLTSVKGSLSLMKSGSSGHIPAEARDLLEIALNNVDRLIATINNVLDVAQLEYGGVQFEISPVSCAELVDEAMKQVQPEAVTRGAKIEVSLPEPPPLVLVDGKRVVQVVRHLLSNAIKFSGPNSKILLSGKAHTGSLIVSVQDFGIGINPEFMSRLFQKFEHQQEHLTRDTQGCGLGLAISKLVVEAHGGRIWVESAEGRGSTFYFSLPLAADTHRTILLVDDDDDVQPTIADYCDHHGFRVLPCHNPKEVVRLARSYRPHIVALDTLQPSGASAEVCTRLAEDPATESIPVVCFVGEQESPAFARGPHRHLLARPLDVSAFGALLDRLLANSGGNGA